MEMPKRLSKIGALEHTDHYHLPVDATCYFWGEYTPPKYVNGKPWDYSATNQLIYNFKKKKGQPGRQFKDKAIVQVANAFSTLWQWDKLLKFRPVLIPIPPSKARNDPMYDDRMSDMLNRLATLSKHELDIRDCLSFDGSCSASHESNERPSPERLFQALSFDENVGRPKEKPGLILLFDDMLTSGAHYVAATRRLALHFPNVKVAGQFIARRRIPDAADEFETL